MADYTPLLANDRQDRENPDPNPDPASPAPGQNLIYIPGLGGYYDPATGQVYDTNKQPTGGKYDPNTDILTDPAGKQFKVGDNMKPIGGGPPGATGPNVTPVDTTKPNTTTTTTTHPGTSGLPSPFTSPFNAPSASPLPTAPVFNPPEWKTPPSFNAPTLQEAQNTPGYQFALQQGLGAISNSQAAQGLWGSGATGKAMQDYAQNYSNQFYGDVYNRAMNSYLTNVQTQYATPYEEQLKAAEDLYQGQLGIFNTSTNATLQQNQNNYANAYNKWLADFNQKYNTAQFLRDTQNS